MARRKDVNWSIDEGVPGLAGASLAVLMDIRDELKQLNITLGCFRVRRMCDDVHRIDKRLAAHMPLNKPKKPA